MSNVPALPGAAEAAAPAPATVLVYSSNVEVRDRVRAAVGRRPDPEVGVLDWVEVADGRACIASVDAGGIDVAVLDGEAWPTGGLGIARQLRDEIADPPATIVLVARADDRWLATWSRADVVLSHPVDPFALTESVVRLLRDRTARPVPAAAPARGFGLRRS